MNWPRGELPGENKISTIRVDSNTPPSALTYPNIHIFTPDHVVVFQRIFPSSLCPMQSRPDNRLDIP